eukprot:scaffold133288_cov78-Phaeocystis_antarctica.AAC.4
MTLVEVGQRDRRERVRDLLGSEAAAAREAGLEALVRVRIRVRVRVRIRLGLGLGVGVGVGLGLGLGLGLELALDHHVVHVHHQVGPAQHRRCLLHVVLELCARDERYQRHVAVRLAAVVEPLVVAPEDGAEVGAEAERDNVRERTHDLGVELGHVVHGIFSLGTHVVHTSHAHDLLCKDVHPDPIEPPEDIAELELHAARDADAFRGRERRLPPRTIDVRRLHRKVLLQELLLLHPLHVAAAQAHLCQVRHDEANDDHALAGQRNLTAECDRAEAVE